MSDLTAEELALEAMLESRLEIITARLETLNKGSRKLANETQELATAVNAKARRMYVIEDNLLRLQGKPGLSHLMLVNGAQPSRGQLFANKNSEIEEEIKMGFKTLRKKFQAAGSVVTTVGWWRHLKEKKEASNPALSGVPVQVVATPVSGTNKVAPVATSSSSSSDKAKAKSEVGKLSVDTTLANQLDTEEQPEETLSPAMMHASPVKPAVFSPKAMLSPTSSSTKRRNIDLQEIFTAQTAAPSKQPHEHYLISPSTQRAHPSLGLFSPPMSPNNPPQSPTSGSGLSRGLSLRS
ncbi:hypothetical protein B0O80DRAFT_428112 [Mortierella sp. GBAus27b]|nr:hypothetical protein BGX31_006587 [Mortierella sp. GBA43]KAI8350975.1 hypothetical protein B0O80DRAFT_428112 [Mortierella sp. GBAus27b]